MTDYGFQCLVPSLESHSRLHTFLFGRIYLGTQPAQRAMADWLANNTQLQNVEFHAAFDSPVYEWQTNSDQAQRTFLLQTIPEALKHNQVLKRCSIHVASMKAILFDAQSAWVELARNHSWVMEALCLKIGGQFDGADQELQQSLLDHLKLSQIGRRELLQPSVLVTQDEHMDKLKLVNDGVSCVYEVMNMYPRTAPSSSSSDFGRDTYTCDFCFEDKSMDTKCAFSNCSHACCRDCLNQILRTTSKSAANLNPSCPFCRTSISKADIWDSCVEVAAGRLLSRSQ